MVVGSIGRRRVDRFIWRSIQLTGICVGWMSYQWALEETVRHGCNLFITHEPTFYDHWDSHPESRFDAAKRKRAFLISTIWPLRCHDLWDHPRYYIPDSHSPWFGPPIGKGWYRILMLGLTVGRSLSGCQSDRRVQTAGCSSDRPIFRLAIGTAPLRCRHFMLEMGCLCTDDDFTLAGRGLSYRLRLASHSGASPGSGEHGLELLANHLRCAQKFGKTHSPKCMYRLISSGR